MKRPHGYLFTVASTVLWLLVAALAAAVALEAFAVAKYRSIENADASLPLHPGWNPKPPVFRSNLQQSATEDLSDESPELQVEEDHLGTLFASLSEEDRATYARLREELIAIYDQDGNNLSVYGEEQIARRFGLGLADLAGKPIGGLFSRAGENALDTVRGILETGEPGVFRSSIETDSRTVSIEVSCFPLPGLSGEVAAVVCSFRNITGLSMTEELALDHESAKDPLWKVPWFEYRKNVRIDAAWYTNNVGFRDDDVVLPKPAGVVRIVCVGGSTTLEGGANDITYPNILERKLRQHFGVDSIDVVNCGVGGVGSLSERKRTLDYVRLEPDLVVHYNFVNDACHDLYPLWEKDAPPWRKILRRSRFLKLYCNARLVPRPAEISAQLDRSTLRNLRMMHECIAGKDIDMAICSFAHPDYPSLSPEEKDYFECHHMKYWQGKHVTFESYCRIVETYNQEVRRLCEDKGIQYIPVSEGLKGGTNYFTDICHTQPVGIELKADILFRHLKDYVAVKLGAGKPEAE